MKEKDDYVFASDLVPPVVWQISFRLVYVFCAALALFYGPSAFQYGAFNIFGPYGPFAGTSMAVATNWTRWNDLLFTPFVPLDYFDGKGSTTAAQGKQYGRDW